MRALALLPFRAMVVVGLALVGAVASPARATDAGLAARAWTPPRRTAPRTARGGE